MAAAKAALVLTSGRGHDRSALAAVRALATAGFRPVVGASGGDSLASASRYSAESCHLPDPGEPSFVEAVASLATSTGAVAVFPSNDDALLALDPGLDRLIDKSRLAEQAGAAGLLAPPTVTFPTAQDMVTAGMGVPYPAVIKPALKQAGLPPYTVQGPDQIRTEEHRGPIIAQPFLDGVADAICGVMWSGKLVASIRQEYIRTWPRACGTAAAAVVVPDDPVRSVALARLLAGYNGVFQAQFVEGALIDLNPRVYGSLPLAVGSGFNLPALACQLAEGKPVASPPTAAGNRYRWIEGDIRNRWDAVRAGDESLATALRDMTPHFDTSHSVFAMLDPGPTLAPLRFAASGRKKGRA